MSLRSLLRPLALAALLLPAAAQAQQVYISTPVQLYAGPDASYPILFTLFPGMGLEVAGCLPGYQWCDVILPDGQRGWVYGGGLSYSWMGEALPVPQYGASIGIPLITFIIGDYWSHHYRNQPWYNEPRHWRHPPSRPMPPPHVIRPPFPEHRGGWNQPYPPHHERGERDWGDRGDRERGRGRERINPPHQPNPPPGRAFPPPQQQERERINPPRQEQIQPQPQPPQQQRPPEGQPRQEREPNRGGNREGTFREHGNRPDGPRGERRE